MTYTPKRRYSAVAVLSDDLDRVVLIHKLRPDWQAGKANLPGGKVEAQDISTRYYASPGFNWNTLAADEAASAYRRCAARELRKETGLDVAVAALQLFCRLRFKSREGDDAECCFYAVKGNVDAARTMESERVFASYVDALLLGGKAYNFLPDDQDYWLLAMPNLPYLVAMARQCLRGEDEAAWPLTVYEAGATP